MHVLIHIVQVTKILKNLNFKILDDLFWNLEKKVLSSLFIRDLGSCVVITLYALAFICKLVIIINILSANKQLGNQICTQT